MASDESDSDDDDYTTGRPERKYRKSARQSNYQQSSLRHVDVIRNVQASRPEPRSQSKSNNAEVWPLERTKHQHSKDTNQSYDGLHRCPMNGDAILANHHPLGMSQTSEENFGNQNWSDNLLRRQHSYESRRSNVFRRQSKDNQRSNRSKNNCLVTSIVIVVILSLIGAGVAAYLLRK